MCFQSRSAAVVICLIIVISVFTVSVAAVAEDDSTTEPPRVIVETKLFANINGGSSRVVDQSCGRSKYTDAGDMYLPSSRIVGGQQARPNEFPWQVSLQFKGRHFCGGSIIASSWILTAANCFTLFNISQEGQYLRVVVGAHRLDDTAGTVIQTFQTTNLYTHNNYSRVTDANDIALLKLSGNITFNENVAPVCLPDSSSSFTFMKSVASGWGHLYWGSPTGSNTLMYTTLNITSNAICISRFRYVTDFSIVIDNSMLCATDNMNDRIRDTCQGDAGGPLAVKAADGRFTLAGITSWGINCTAGYPGVYTRVSTFVDSIHKLLTDTTPAVTATTPAAPRQCMFVDYYGNSYTQPCNGGRRSIVSRGIVFTLVLALFSVIMMLLVLK